jgi:hypothetical protein
MPDKAKVPGNLDTGFGRKMSPAELKAVQNEITKAATPKPKGTQANHAVTDTANHTKPLTGAAAIAELQRQVSPSGVKQAEVNAKKAIDKKYPGLYKK